MKLAEYQRAVLHQSLALDSAPALPDFALYRQMIRGRFEAMAQIAFRRSWSLLGASRCAASFARYLSAVGPRSPILREVIGAFAEFAVDDAALLTGAAELAVDLLRFEASIWRVASAEDPVPDERPVRELDFEGVLVLNPTLAQLALKYDVCQPEPRTSYDPHTLLVYRRPGEDDVHWYRAPELLRELLELSDGGERSVGAVVQDVLSRRAPHTRGAALEELAGAVTLAVERGVLRGVRDAGASAQMHRLQSNVHYPELSDCGELSVALQDRRKD